jgi:hypothetical protein
MMPTHRLYRRTALVLAADYLNFNRPQRMPNISGCIVKEADKIHKFPSDVLKKGPESEESPLSGNIRY